MKGVIAGVIALLLFVDGIASAQQPSPFDTALKDTIPLPDTVIISAPVEKATEGIDLKPPLSPSRAFFTSLLLPGYAQSKLDRPVASMIYAVFEVVSIGMLRKSAQDLKSAKKFGGDSVVIGYNPGADGQFIPVYEESSIGSERIKARRLHYEDWVAAIIFNHLISAADAYVAAYLWDFKANISISSGGDRKKASIGLSKSFR